ncbi:hypothetical protein NX059_009120 [Plenodomus lindquistii]|nr:hypothetical protein NX059_009120 [Plenodomus lindquistii]
MASVSHGSFTATSSASVENPDTSNLNPISSNPPLASEVDSVEVQNTPTQRSSELEASSLPSALQTLHEPEVEVEDVDFTVPAQPLAGTIAQLTVLCATCRTQRVFAKNQGEDVHCRNCRNRSLITATGKVEIPETPHAASQIQLHATQSPKNPLSVAMPPMSASPSTVPWFQTNLVASRPEVKQKKVGNEVISSPVEAQRESITEQNDSEEMRQVTGSVHQAPVCTVVSSMDLLSPKPNTTVQGSDALTAKEAESPVSIEAYLEEPEKDPVSPSAMVLPIDVSNDDESESNLVMESDSGALHIDDDAMPLQDEEPRSVSVLLNGHALPDIRSSSSEKVLERSGSETVDKRYTYRELAIIALVAAGDSSLTAAETTDWLAKEFSHLKKAQGSWEIAVKSRLSSMPEVRRTPNIAGTGHSLKRYSFANEATRARFRAEFAQYCDPVTTSPSESAGPSNSITKPLARAEDAGVPRPTLVKKTAPSRLDSPILKPPQPPEATHVAQTTPATLSEGLSTPSMPFERINERIPQVQLLNIPGAQRETSYEAFLKAQTSPVELMTDEQKMDKIAEIKARPSRKQFFGSDHRLGHVRHYRRQDIHDESDGAWKLPLKTMGEQKEDTRMLDGPTLREVFGLPSKAIPMNDAQSELAFRDATRVCGSFNIREEEYCIRLTD